MPERLFAQTSQGTGYGTLLMLVLFIGASMYIGVLANRAMRSGSFLKGFFLGNRGLGAWALALTATVQSGGTFMGFPSLVYTHGWSVALWIAGYMVVPITGFGILGKRLAQLSRKTGAITVPDMFRERFASPRLGLVASLFILFYMSFMMVAQFKAGALVMKLAWPGSGVLALSEDAAAYRLSAASLETLPLSTDEKQNLVPLIGQGFETEGEASKALDGVTTNLGANKAAVLSAMKPLDWLYLIGLAVFTITVVGYTLLGGFLAAVWTDLFQSVMMAIGVVLLLSLSLSQAGGLETASRKALDKVKEARATALKDKGLEADPAELEQAASQYAFGPGYDYPKSGDFNPDRPREFMPLGLAISAFFVWVFSGMGSPAGMVRVMASESTAVIRRSIYLLSAYNACIYIPLIIICICAMAILPPLPATDEVIPRMAIKTTEHLWGGSLIAGLILAAPFGAVMATVSSYLVVISSGLVRDVYQRFINPEATQHEMRRLSYLVMVLVGAAAVAANIQPVAYLQAIVVFSGTGAAATFCFPALMLCYWRRATVPGMIASMISGATTMIVMYALPQVRLLLLDRTDGKFELFTEQRFGQFTGFRPYFLLEIDPLLWGLLVSCLTGLVVSLLTRPPDEKVVSRMFDAHQE